MCGGVMIGSPDSPVVDGTMKSIKAHNMPHEVLSAAAMRERYPLFRLSEDDIGVYEANAGVLMAEPCIETFIAQARLHGADLRFEEPMLEWSAVGAGDADAPAGLTRGVRVRTSKGTYFGRKLVLSVGAWAVGLYGKAIPQAQLYIERRVLFWFKASAEAVEGFKVRTLLFSFSCCSRP
jgi:sarcosine oxidase